ncbi:MAG TPA: c-type cytochrome [Steroidobacteraceae bacterium]
MQKRGPFPAVLAVVLAAAFCVAVQAQEPAKPSTAATASQSRPAPEGAGKSESKSESSGDSEKLYTVKDGNKVDEKTLNGWKTWRALACERCHGAEQEGLVGPALRDTIKTISKEEFHEIMVKGRPEKGMPPFSTSKMVMENWEGLYAYLRGRGDGKIQPGRLTAIDK